MGVVLLAILGLATAEPLVRVNGLRSVLSLVVNTVAMVIFVVHAAHRPGEAAGLIDRQRPARGVHRGAHCPACPGRALRVVVVILGLATAVHLLAS